MVCHDRFRFPRWLQFLERYMDFMVHAELHVSKTESCKSVRGRAEREPLRGLLWCWGESQQTGAMPCCQAGAKGALFMSPVRPACFCFAAGPWPIKFWHGLLSICASLRCRALSTRTRMVQCFGIQVHHHHHFNIPHACWSSCHECGNAVFDQSVALFLCHRSEDLHCF